MLQAESGLNIASFLDSFLLRAPEASEEKILF